VGSLVRANVFLPVPRFSPVSIFPQGRYNCLSNTDAISSKQFAAWVNNTPKKLGQPIGAGGHEIFVT